MEKLPWVFNIQQVGRSRSKILVFYSFKAEIGVGQNWEQLGVSFWDKASSFSRDKILDETLVLFVSAAQEEGQWSLVEKETDYSLLQFYDLTG